MTGAPASADRSSRRSNGALPRSIETRPSWCTCAAPKACWRPRHRRRRGTAGGARSRSSASWDAAWADATAASCRCAPSTAAVTTCDRASPDPSWRAIRSCGISSPMDLHHGPPDLSVHIGSLKLKNPLIAASGCFGYGVEYADTIDLSSLGGVAVKGLFLAAREGHRPPRIVETPAGMLNAIGLQGIGVRRFIDEKLPELRVRRATVIVNICGTTIDEYVEVSRILSDAEGVGALELNISLPNIKEGGITFGCSLNGTFGVVSAVRKVTRLPLFPKLTPNVTDIAPFARAAEDAGADAVSLVNT